MGEEFLRENFKIIMPKHNWSFNSISRLYRWDVGVDFNCEFEAIVEFEKCRLIYSKQIHELKLYVGDC